MLVVLKMRTVAIKIVNYQLLKMNCRNDVKII